MFEGSLVESTSLLHSQSRKPLYTSLAIQAAIATALVTIPLMHPEIITTLRPPMTLFAPPRPPAPRPPAPHVVHVEASTATSAPSAPAAPSARIADFRRAATSTPIEGQPEPTAIIMGGGDRGGPIGWASSPAAANVSVVPSHAATRGPVRLSTGVSIGLLIAPIQPVYPTIAKAAGVHGTVVVQAIISPTGHIESARALSGPAMLQGAALDAVRNARYHPFLLNGQPTAVDTTFTINFVLGNG